MKKLMALILVVSSAGASVGVLHRGTTDVMAQDSLILRTFLDRTMRVKQALNPYWRQSPPLFTIPAFKNGLGGSGKSDTLVIRVLAIRVDFPLEDPDDPATTGNGKFRLTDNGRNPILRVDENGDTVFNPLYDPPHDKKYFEHLMEYVADYYRNVTYGRVKVEFVVIPQEDDSVYHLTHSIRYYGDTNNWLYGLAAIIRDAFKVADQDNNLPFTFTDLDGNGVKDAMEGVLDRYVIFHAGSAWQTDVMRNTPFDIPAVYVPPSVIEYAFGRPFIILNEGIDTVWDAAVMPEQMSQDGVESRLQATLVHELMHNFFSAPDLYDVSYHGAGIGAWGIMATGGYLSYTSEDDTIPEGLIAPLPNAFSRWWVSWVTDLIWGAGGTLGSEFVTVAPGTDPESLTIYPSAVMTDSNGNFLVDPHSLPRFYKIPINDHEYYLVEYRKKDLNADSTVKGLWRDGVFVSFFGENDYLLPGEGLLIWHIDEDILWDNYSYNEVQVPRPMAVDLEEADHVQDLESYMPPDMHPYQYVWFGCPYDPFFEGNNTEFSDTSRPSSLDNEGGHTGIKVYEISRPETTMTFVLTLDYGVKGFPTRLIPEQVTIDSNRNFVRYRSNSVKRTFLKFDSSSGTLWAVADVSVDTVRENYITGDVDTLSSFDAIDIFAIDTAGNIIATSEITNQGFTYGIAAGDLDGDSIAELVFGTTNRKLYAFKLSNTGIEPYWLRPVSAPDAIMSPPMITRSSILIGNENQELVRYGFNGAPNASLFVGTPLRTPPSYGDGELWLLSSDGQLFLLDPSTLEPEMSLFDGLVLESLLPAALADIDHDGKAEAVIARVTNYGETGYVAVVSDSGEILWDDELIGRPIGGPAIGDIDNDGYPEVVVLTDRRLYAFNHNGSAVSGFPVAVEADSAPYPCPLILADADGNGMPDILFPNHTKGIQGFDRHGRPLRNFPLQLADNGDVIAVNMLTGTENAELLAFDRKGFLRGYQLQGSIIHWSQFGNSPGNTSFATFNGDTVPHGGTGIDRVYFYPNPTHNGISRLRFRAFEPGKVEVMIVTQAGTILRRLGPFDVKGEDFEEVELDLRDVASGVYFVRVVFDLPSGKYGRFLKLVIER